MTASRQAGSLGDPLPVAGVLLGLDYGSRRIGVAATDPLRVAAHPLGALPAGNETELWERLRALARERDAVGLVVGLPLNMDGSEGPAAKAARKWGARAGAALNFPVRFVDERLSSQGAERDLLAAGLSHRKRKARVDAVAACTVLQTVLDEPAWRADSGSAPVE